MQPHESLLCSTLECTYVTGDILYHSVSFAVTWYVMRQY